MHKKDCSMLNHILAELEGPIEIAKTVSWSSSLDISIELGNHNLVKSTVVCLNGNLENIMNAYLLKAVKLAPNW